MKHLLFHSFLLFLVVNVDGQGPVSIAHSYFGSAAQPGVDKARVMEYFQEQEFAAAIDYLRPALEADSANVLLLGWAGYAWYMSDHFRESEDCYRRVLRVDSGNVSALHYLLLIGDSVSVEMDYARRLVALQPRKSAWWRIMGGLWAK